MFCGVLWILDSFDSFVLCVSRYVVVVVVVVIIVVEAKSQRKAFRVCAVPLDNPLGPDVWVWVTRQTITVALQLIKNTRETYIRSGTEEGLDYTVKEADIKITAKVENTLVEGEYMIGSRDLRSKG